MHNPQFFAMVASDHEYMDTDFDEYPTPSPRSLMCCRIVAIIVRSLSSGKILNHCSDKVCLYTLVFAVYGSSGFTPYPTNYTYWSRRVFDDFVHSELSEYTFSFVRKIKDREQFGFFFFFCIIYTSYSLHYISVTYVKNRWSSSANLRHGKSIHRYPASTTPTGQPLYKLVNELAST